MSKDKFNEDAEKSTVEVADGLDQLMSSISTLEQEEREAARLFRQKVEVAFGQFNRTYNKIMPSVVERYYDFADQIPNLPEDKRQSAQASADVLRSAIEDVDSEWERIQKVMKIRYYACGEAVSIIGRLERVQEELKHVQETYIDTKPETSKVKAKARGVKASG